MTFAYAALGVWYALHKIFDSPIFLCAPPAELFMARLKSCFGKLESTSESALLQAYSMPDKSSKFLFIRIIIFVITMPISDLYMLIDDIIWGKEYRKVSLEDSIFLVGGFRTGSTSLHRTLAMDEERFVSPRFIEVTFPFLWLHYFFDWLERRDKEKGTSTIKNIEKKLQNAIGEENMARRK